MTNDVNNKMTRRLFLRSSAATMGVLASPALAQSTGEAQIEEEISSETRRNISSFRSLEWQPYFANLSGGAILVDTTSRALHYWSADETMYKLYPTSVPMSEDLTRLGRTKIVRKVDGPSWRPTPSMLKRNPEWPAYIAPGPENPMGTHALHLSWTYYRIHGTHDTRKIGRRSSNGCIGLYNKHIQELFALATVGTQVLLI
ncbi:MAG: L,D-transpeptidase [Marinosulfonomonas sp.]|nr:L,D-transpeptidase [Marinosulfonomonas sp.]